MYGMFVVLGMFLALADRVELICRGSSENISAKSNRLVGHQF
jgi:hypothetical protein